MEVLLGKIISKSVNLILYILLNITFQRYIVQILPMLYGAVLPELRGLLISISIISKLAYATPPDARRYKLKFLVKRFTLLPQV